MKKLALTSVLALAASGAAFAQGTLAWNTITFSAVTAQTVPSVESTFTPGGVAPGGTTALTGTTVGTYYYELLYSTSATQVAAPTTIAGLAAWSDTGLEGENGATAGHLQTLTGTGATAVNPGPSAATVPFSAATSLVLVGWSANLGNTWQAAEAALENNTSLTLIDGVSQAYFGTTPSGFVTPNSSTSSLGAPIFGTGTGEIKSLLTPLDAVNPLPTPEPTTIALGVMGGLSLLALRRKKA